MDAAAPQDEDAGSDGSYIDELHEELQAQMDAREAAENRVAELEAAIKDLKELLGSEELQLQVMLEELADVVKKYGDARRTVIIDDQEDELETASVEHQLADEDVVVTLSHEGFVKRIPMHLYRRRVGSGKALAGMERYEDDYLERIFVTRSL